MAEALITGTDVTIGIDIGTTSVKAVAADAQGFVVADIRIEHDVLTPGPGTLQHDAVLAWRDGVRRAAAEIATAVADAGHTVTAVDVAAMVPSLSAVDAHGIPLSSGLLYGDRRASPTQDSVGQGLSPAEDGEFVRMLTWLASQHPEAAGYWPAQAVANHALCGVGTIDSVTAMTTVPAFDYVGWDSSVCATAGVSTHALPRIVSGSDPAGKVVTGVHPALDGVPVGGGTIDAFAEQIVAGANNEGDVLVIIGATLITWAVIPKWVEVAGLWTVPHTAPGLSLIGGPSNAGGITRDWATRVLRPIHPDESGKQVDPDDVPVLLPHLRGERVPLHDPHRRGVFLDLNVSHGPAAMWRAVHEATGHTVRRILDLAHLLEGETCSRRIVATGGGSNDDAWMQALSDVTGLRVDCVAESKGAALGAALFAARMAGLDSASDWSRVGRSFRPDDRWVAGCERRYRRFVQASGDAFDPVGASG